MAAAIQSWKTIMLSLSDQDFFDIIRNYLGPVKTPYNKHTLIKRLVSFIEKNRHTIISNIAEDDAALISAIAFMEKPDTLALQQMFQTEKKYLELHLHLLNLEERLLIFRTENCYKLNPLLSSELKKQIIHPSYLIKTREAEKRDKNSAAAMRVTPNVFFALISLLHHKIKPGDKRPWKSLASLSETILTEPLPIARHNQLIESLYGIMLKRGLIGRNSDGFLSVDQSFLDRNQFTAKQFAWWLLGSFLLADGTSGPVLKSITDPLRFLKHLLSWLPARGLVHKNDIKRIIILFENGILGDYASAILKACIDSGFLAESGKTLVCLNPGLNSWINQFEGKADIIVSQAFEITIPPQLEPTAYMKVCLFSEVRQCDIYARYEISKHSVHNAFNGSMEYEQLTKFLEDSSRHALPQNIGFSLKNWFEEFSRITVIKGMFLVLKEDIAGIIEKSGVISRWIIKTIAPGIYLMDERAEKSWKTALEKSGMENIPDTVYAEDNSPSMPMNGETYGQETDFPEIILQDPLAQKQKDPENLKMQTDEKSLQAALAKSQLRREEKAELKAKIEKKVIILPEQIRGGLLKPEKSEARGMDYSGKLRIIDQALKSGKDLLEVQEAQSGEITKNLVEPVKLDKSSDDVILFGRTLPDHKDWNIKVRKISYLKKLKASLFIP